MTGSKSHGNWQFGMSLRNHEVFHVKEGKNFYINNLDLTSVAAGTICNIA